MAASIILWIVEMCRLFLPRVVFHNNILLADEFLVDETRGKGIRLVYRDIRYDELKIPRRIYASSSTGWRLREANKTNLRRIKQIGKDHVVKAAIVKRLLKSEVGKIARQGDVKIVSHEKVQRVRFSEMRALETMSRRPGSEPLWGAVPVSSVKINCSIRGSIDIACPENASVTMLEKID